jgi:hypothetical protein
MEINQIKKIKIYKIGEYITIEAEYLNGEVLYVPNDQRNRNYQEALYYFRSLKKTSKEYKDLKKQMDKVEFEFED